MQTVSFWRQFAGNLKAYFLGEVRKNIISLLSAEFAQRVKQARTQMQFVGKVWGRVVRVGGGGGEVGV